MIGSRSLKSLRSKIAKCKKIGSSRVRFTQQTRNELAGFKERIWPNHLVKSLSEKVRVIAKKKRLYKIYRYAQGKRYTTKTIKGAEIKVKNTIKRNQSMRYLLKKRIITKKDIWMRKLREMRAFLKKKKITLSNYGILRRKAKADHFKTLEDLKRYISANEQ